MPPEDIVRLRHMLEAIEDASSFISGRVRSDLDADKMLRFALVRCVEIVWKTVTSELSALAAALRPLLQNDR